MDKHLTTPIEGVKILLNKVIGDERGWLGELVPGGSAHPDLKEGFGNLYVSTALGKGIARAGHYHHIQSELFFTLTGTALWAFYDYRKNSKTFGQTYGMILSDIDIKKDLPTYKIGKEVMPGIVVPHGVYHVYWALEDSPVRVVCVATAPHSSDDYVNISPAKVPGLKELAIVCNIEI